MDGIAEMKALLQKDDGDEIVVLGDTNARYGKLMYRVVDLSPSWRYHGIDNTSKPNANVRHLIDVLGSRRVLLSGLETELTKYTGSLTYRKGKQWISCLDHFHVSPCLVDYMGEPG